MIDDEDEGFGWLPVELAKRILSQLSPIENCMLSQVRPLCLTLCRPFDLFQGSLTLSMVGESLVASTMLYERNMARFLQDTLPTQRHHHQWLQEARLDVSGHYELLEGLVRVPLAV